MRGEFFSFWPPKWAGHLPLFVWPLATCRNSGAIFKWKSISVWLSVVFWYWNNQVFMSCLRLEPCCLFRNCCSGTGALFRNKINIPTFIRPITSKLIVLNRKIRPHLHTDQTPSATEMQRQPVAMIFFFAWAAVTWLELVMASVVMATCRP